MRRRREKPAIVTEVEFPRDDEPTSWPGMQEEQVDVEKEPSDWRGYVKFGGVGHRLGSLDDVVVPPHAPPPVVPIAAAAAAAPDPTMASAAQNVQTHEKVIPLFVNNPPPDIQGDENGEWHLEVPESWLKDERNWTPDFLDLFIQKDELLTPEMQRLFRTATPEEHEKILGFFNLSSLPDELREKLKSTRRHNFLQLFDLGRPKEFRGLGQVYARLFFNVISYKMKQSTRLISLCDLMLCGILDPITFLVPDILNRFHLKVPLEDILSPLTKRNIPSFLDNKPWQNTRTWGEETMIHTYIGTGPFFNTSLDLPRENYNSSMIGLYCCLHNILLIDLDPQNLAVPCIIRYLEYLKGSEPYNRRFINTILQRGQSPGIQLRYIQALAFYINWFFSYFQSEPSLSSLTATNIYLSNTWDEVKTTINNPQLIRDLETYFITPISSRRGTGIGLWEIRKFLDIMNTYQKTISKWLVDGNDDGVKVKLGRDGNIHLPYINPRFDSCISLWRIKTPAKSYTPNSIYYHPELWSSSRTPILPIDSHDFTPPISSWSSSVTNRIRPLQDDFPSLEAPTVLTHPPFVYPAADDFRGAWKERYDKWYKFTYDNIPDFIYKILQRIVFDAYELPIYTFNQEGVVPDQEEAQRLYLPPRLHEGYNSQTRTFTDSKTSSKVSKLFDVVYSPINKFWKIPDVFIPRDENELVRGILFHNTETEMSTASKLPLLSISFGADIATPWCRLLTQFASRENMVRSRSAKAFINTFNPAIGGVWNMRYPPIYCCASGGANIFNHMGIDDFRNITLPAIYRDINRIIIYVGISAYLDVPTTAEKLRRRTPGDSGGHAIVVGFDKSSNSIILYDSSNIVRGLLGLSNIFHMRNARAWRPITDLLFPDVVGLTRKERERTYNATIEDLINIDPSDVRYPRTTAEKENMIQQLLENELHAVGYQDRENSTATMLALRTFLAHHVWTTCRGADNIPPFDYSRVTTLSFLEICRLAAAGGHPFNFQFSYGNQTEQNKCCAYSAYAAMFLTMQPTYTFVPPLASPSYSPETTAYNSVSETVEQFLMYMVMCLERGEIISSQTALREQVRKFLRLKLRRQFGLMDYLSTWIPPAWKRRRREEPPP